MGMIGDLLYPDNPDLAKEANEDQKKLQKTHELHNALVTSYRQVADKTRTFDSYLMSILAMQYYFVYAKEDLEDMPDTDCPTITQSLADKIESVALDALSIKMGYNGIKAIYNRLSNVTREGGTFRENIAEGPESVSEELAPEIDSIAAQSEVISSANIDMLTNTSMTGEELSAYATELGEAGESLETMVSSGELGEASELPELSDVVTAGVDATAEVMEGAEAAGEAAAEAGVEAAATSACVGAAAVLGPAIIIVIIVTEIFSAIEAAETHEKLEKALTRLRKMQKQADASLVSLKKAYASLLKGGLADIKAYNKVLKKMYQLEKNEAFNRSFSGNGLTSYANALDGITFDTMSSIQPFQKSVDDELSKALDYIRTHAINDSGMTEVITMIRSHIKENGPDSVDDNFLSAIATDLDTDIKRVQSYYKFSRMLNDIGSALLPYHKQIQTQTPKGSKAPARPAHPEFGKYEPSFQPHPDQFTIPAIGK